MEPLSSIEITKFVTPQLTLQGRGQMSLRDEDANPIAQILTATLSTICAILGPTPSTVRFLTPVLVLAGCLTSAVAAPAEPDIRRDATVAAVEKVMPSVVNIATETIIQVRDPFENLFREFWDPYHRRQPANSQYSLGSGVVIDEAGYLLTNDHVVRRADKIAVKFSSGTNFYEAEVVATDPKTDVALLRLKGRPGERFHAIRLAQPDDLLLGETVLALGNPFGLGGSVTRGILSSKSRMAPKEGVPLDVPNWLQTDAPINLGSSGGPLVNLRGELIGINVAVLQSAQGIGFAIPIGRVMEALSEIFPTEFVKSYWFGARVKVGTSPLAIASVQTGSPAGKAGLRPGDAILAVNGTAPKSFIDFADLLASGARAPVTLTVERDGAHQEFGVKLVPEESVFNETMVRDRLGLELQELSPQAAARYGVKQRDGLLITGVTEDSPAAAAGLTRGVLVTSFDGRPLTDITAIAKVVFAKKPRDRMQLDITVRQRVGNFNVLRQGTVELELR